ncbi:uncharacterized protein L969DRAFT_96247 [Mixia osmundae IAM 14324]|uniref:Mitochondrial zinc maintenance protein 1, mitochondrial n=1 Tax=Mixia osmundae (strain CBS 9802 / IAM 14324 / JCM 22182 / KY 12970) TaxID=764103 RepID=G7E4V6_MIXOS|nr:uncharacterized protein L969DRAFT_96247 [Mixia osmundae IAM 14324]KEI37729.1 hypothetical protein L969DRAFT_96247 [Mixia osmundae IAM 14324]GAA97866.1 hypothetical protein E5Q_04546 [Mixia osmundae IAM 14324]
MSSARTQIASAYRELLRAQHATFGHDRQARLAARPMNAQLVQAAVATLSAEPTATMGTEQATENKQRRRKQMAPATLEEALLALRQVALFFRRNVVQGQHDAERARIGLKITKDTELGDNETVKAKTVNRDVRPRIYHLHGSIESDGRASKSLVRFHRAGPLDISPGLRLECARAPAQLPTRRICTSFRSKCDCWAHVRARASTCEDEFIGSTRVGRALIYSLERNESDHTVHVLTERCRDRQTMGTSGL